MWRGETPKGNGRLVLVLHRMTTARTARRWPSKNEALQKLRWHAFVTCPIVLDRLLCTSRYPLQDLRCSVSLSSGCPLSLSAIRHTSLHSCCPSACPRLLPFFLARLVTTCKPSSPPSSHDHCNGSPLPPTPDRNTTRAAADAVPEVTGHAPSVCRDS